MTTEGRVVWLNLEEILTGKLARPMGKEDLDVFRTHLAGRCCFAEDDVGALDAVRMWRAGQETAAGIYAAFFRAIFGD